MRLKNLVEKLKKTSLIVQVESEMSSGKLTDIADLATKIGFIVARKPIFPEIEYIRPFRDGDIITRRVNYGDCHYSSQNAYYVGISSVVPLEFQIFLSFYFLKYHPRVNVFMYLVYPEPSNIFDLSYIKVRTEYKRKDLAEPYHSNFFTPDELYPFEFDAAEDYLKNCEKRHTWDDSVSWQQRGHYNGLAGWYEIYDASYDGWNQDEYEFNLSDPDDLETDEYTSDSESFFNDYYDHLDNRADWRDEAFRNEDWAYWNTE